MTHRSCVLLVGALAACGTEGGGDSGQHPDQHSLMPCEAGGPLAALPQPAGFSTPVLETAPPDNELTEERAQLGKRLFYDPVLSRDRTVSCSTCHRQEYGFSEPLALTEGIDGQLGTRNTPHLINLAWVNTGLFWDGRASTLEEQAIQPIENPLEMDLAVDRAVDRLKEDASYVSAFEEAYAAPPSSERLAAAIASFVRTLVSAQSPFDRHLAGDDTALSASARRGFELFLSGETGCFHCHSAETLTNDGYFNNGTFMEGGDVGRQSLTGRTGDLGKFRVPSLRNVAVTGPYMHDGSVATLSDVVEHYSAGGNGHPSTDVQIEPLDLSKADKDDLVAFLQSLTDEEFLTALRFQPCAP